MFSPKQNLRMILACVCMLVFPVWAGPSNARSDDDAPTVLEVIWGVVGRLRAMKMIRNAKSAKVNIASAKKRRTRAAPRKPGKSGTRKIGIIRASIWDWP